jgi:mycoredoxin
MSNLYNPKPEITVLYGTSWCPDCRRARRVFVEQQSMYLDIDIEADGKAAEFVAEINNGNRSVPTIVFPDGAVLVEPANDVLAQKIQSLKKSD